MGDADTASGRTRKSSSIRPAHPTPPWTIRWTPASLPTPTTAAVPDVVQVLPASTSTTAAGTPVTIEGNYFATSPVPQVFFGGVAATNVAVNWDGELTADAPADPAGTATDRSS